jgi:hypothetical protein
MIIQIIIIICLLLSLLIFTVYKNDDFECIQNTSIKRLSKFLNNDNVLMCYNYDHNNVDKYNKTIFLSHNNNKLISNKMQLWQTLKNYYGISKASTITPMTFLIPFDYNQYLKQGLNKKIIFKQNTHRQEGLFVTNQIQSLDFLTKEDFIVGQIFIENTLRFHNYRVSFRMYLVLGCVSNIFESYIFDDGMVYYGTENIASFYESSNLYLKYPIIISDLEYQMNIQIRDIMIKQIKLLVLAIKNNFCGNDKKNKFYEIYGIDFQITDDFKAYILEVNSGPGMDANDFRDEKLRNNLMKFYSNIINKQN